MNNWMIVLVVLCVIVPGMFIFYLERGNSTTLTEVSEIVSFVAGSFFGYLSALLSRDKR